MPPPTVKSIEVWNAVVAKLAAMTAGTYNLTPGAVLSALEDVRNVSAFPALMVLPPVLSSEHATANGPVSTMKVQATFTILHVAKSDTPHADLLKTDADIQNCLTAVDGSGRLLGLDYVQEVYPGDSDPVVLAESIDQETRWRSREMVVEFFHMRGDA